MLKRILAALVLGALPLGSIGIAPAEATVASTANTIQYAGNGTVTAFAFPYAYFVATDLSVTLFNTTTNAAVVPAPVLNGGATYDYTVTGVAAVSTIDNVTEYISATITFNTAPPGGDTIILQRAVPATQALNLLDNSKFPAASVNAELDKLTMLQQQVGAQAGRALQGPASDPAGINYTLPPAATRAGQYAAFDARGNAVTVPGTSTASDLSAYTVLAKGGTVAQALGVLFGQALTVEGMGAKCDGSTNDAAAFAAAAAVGPFTVPPGTCVIGSTLAIAAPVTFAAGAAIEPASGATASFTGPVIAPVDAICNITLGGHCDFSAAQVLAAPVEWWGANIANSAAANTAPINEAIAHGPHYLAEGNCGGILSTTGHVMYPSHEIRGCGMQNPTAYISCSGIPYVYAAELTGSYLATRSVCFQEGIQAGYGDLNVMRDVKIVTTDLTSVIAVAIADSTSVVTNDQFACENSAFEGYVGMYWGVANADVVSNCNFEGGSGAAPWGELYELANVAGLKQGVIQNILHLGGDVQMSQTSTGGAIGMIDAGATYRIFGNEYLRTRVDNAATCFTLVPGTTPMSFDGVGIETCGTVLSETNSTSSQWINPQLGGGNLLSQLLSEIGTSSHVWYNGTHYTKSGNGFATATLGHVDFVGSGSPTGVVSAQEDGDTYWRTGAGANPWVNTPCVSSSSGSSSWVAPGGGAC